MASSKVARRRQGSLGPLPKDSPPPAVNGGTGAASPAQSLDNLEMIKTIGQSPLSVSIGRCRGVATSTEHVTAANKRPAQENSVVGRLDCIRSV